MRKFTFLAAIILIALNACQKATTQTNTTVPPPNTDTIKKVSADTSYLRKTQTYFAYDPTGTNITDSVRTAWTYNSKGRELVVVTNIFTPGIIDSTFNTYTASTQVSRMVSYTNNVLSSDVTSTFYLNASGNPDSLLSTIYSYGGGTPGPQYSFYYYHYNDKNQDTLENGYTLTNSTKSQFIKLRQTYLNDILDSSILYYNDTTVIYDIKLFAAGNLTQELTYLSGVLWVTVSFTQTNILSGGFYGYTGNLELTKSIVQVYPASPSDNRTEDFTYSFDGSNRVIGVNRSQNNIITQKEVYTYY
jgi:hypothetical protein